MSNLPLKALVWKDDVASSEVQHELFNYRVIPDHESTDKFAVRYKDSNSHPATGFATIEDAKAWAWGNYNEKMQPYVKPMPTWISVDDILPSNERFYLVRLFDGHRDEHVFVILWWNIEHQQFLEWDAMCEPTHWMPIPEFSTMQNLHKGE